MKTFTEDMKDLMRTVKKVMMSNYEKQLNELSEAINNGTEVSMQRIVNMFSDYDIVNSECGFTMYVLAPDNSWIFGIEFICTDEDYNVLLVDSIIYPHDYKDYM